MIILNYFNFWLQWHMGAYFPYQASNPRSMHWQQGVSTTGHQRILPCYIFNVVKKYIKFTISILLSV